ncbi:MAG: lysophospholipid acyltransferase family protein [Proteobacteria bacterium]|nr:lysophospholipid acyltransferase family protein [Pseudomonadota bacterium]MDA1323232.1 lysophospholipid acyltransferase family protein [Pseudomonadota bacterium]
MKDQRNGRQRVETLSSSWRAVGRILLAAPYTVMLLPLQTAVLALDIQFARWLPKFFHRQWCRIFGIHIRAHGKISPDRPTLFVANHVSYLDIIVLSSILDASFIAKSEVAGWPILGLLARFQRTLFVERRRPRAAVQRDDISERLRAGDSLILFPEGASNDGQRVQPFKSALFSVAERHEGDKPLTIQPISLAYTRLDGIPLNRAFRPQYAWFGDMTLMPHLFEMLGIGTVTVEVILHDLVLSDGFETRKSLAQFCHGVVVRGVDTALSGRRPSAVLSGTVSANS